MTTESISADFPFESRYVEIHGSKMHYIDEGEGDPILFLHGNPTSSYLWRNIIPHLTPHGRCIAPDLIGMGKSDKPDIGYRFFDHVKYLEGFIEELDLSNLTVVLHDWGSGLGFHYAMRHESNIKGIAFMEAMMKPFSWKDFPSDQRNGFKLFRSSFGWFMISVMNVFVNKLLPSMIVRKLSSKEMEIYKAPYKTFRSRKPVRQWPREIPIDGSPSDVHEVLSDFSQRLQDSELPKILFHANPGVAIDEEVVAWCRENLKNLTVRNLSTKVRHFLFEFTEQLPVAFPSHLA